MTRRRWSPSSGPRRLPVNELGHHPQGVGHRGLVAADVVEPAAGTERARQHQAAAGDEAAVDLHEQGIGVKQRHAAVVDVFCRQTDGADLVVPKQVEVSVGHEHPFGRPGGARRVHDGADIVVVHRHRGRRGRRLQQLGKGKGAQPGKSGQGACRAKRVGDNGRLQLGHVGFAGLQLRHVSAIDEDEAGGAVVDHVLQKGAFVCRIDGHQHGAEAVDTKPGLQELDTVGQHHQHPVAVLHPQLGQRPGEAAGALVHGPEGMRGLVFELHKGLLGPRLGLLRQDGADHPPRFVHARHDSSPRWSHCYIYIRKRRP
ncbi:MAG: hypothetical protein KatS3mg131_1616 [Candidatus Tectimicrobiota bacterium]|nr:MAG: hypothetical protein KatS3mg131_1616 [Candidatus Tectomicrobia bacterium]